MTEKIKLYRGEGQNRPMGNWWTPDLKQAQNYAKDANGKVYILEVTPEELDQNFFEHDTGRNIEYVYTDDMGNEELNKRRKEFIPKKDKVAKQNLTKNKPKVDKGKLSNPDDCLKIGEEALASFTRSEIQDYVSEVKSRSGSYDDVKGQAAIQKAIDEMHNEKLNELFGDCKTKANNIAKFEARAADIKKGWKNNLRTLLTPRGRSQSDNLSQAQKSAKGSLADIAFKGMTHEQQEYLRDRKNNADIFSALDGDHSSSMAQSIAKIINENYIPFRDAEMVRTDALSVYHLSEYKYLDHMHDASSMMMGGDTLLRRAKNLASGIKAPIEDPRKAWIEFIKSKLDAIGDLEVNEKNNEKIDKTLSNVYDNITQNKSQPFTQSTIVNDREAKRQQKIMKLKFKDWKSWGTYNEKYGRKDIFSALMADINGSGNRIGTSDFMGDSPANAYLDLKKIQEKIGLNTKSPNLWFKNTDLQFKELIGYDQGAVSPNLARYRANISALTSAVRLVSLPIRSLPDFAHGMAYLGRFAHNEFKSLGVMLLNAFNNPIGGLLFPERAQIAKMFKLMCDSHMGYVARIVDSNNVGDLVSRISTGLMKPIELFDKGNQISVLHLMSKTLGNHSKYGWEALPDNLRRQLEYFNLSKEEWNLLRSKTKDGLFTLDNLDSVSDQEMRGLDSNIPLANLRNDLFRKVYSVFDVASQNMLMTPDAWGKAWLHQGTTPGTYLGELVRLFTQFKMYPITYFDRAWNQSLRQLEGTSPKLWYATRLMASSMVLAWLSEWMNNYAQGKTMPEPSQMTAAQRLKYYTSLAAPGGGVFLGIMDKRNQNKNLLWSTMRSPSTDLIGDALSAILGTITGDLDQAKKELKNIGKGITPIDSIPGISPYLREALGEKPYLQPGQQQIYGA